MVGRVCEWADGWMAGKWVSRRMNGWMGGRVDGRMEELISE